MVTFGPLWAIVLRTRTASASALRTSTRRLVTTRATAFRSVAWQSKVIRSDIINDRKEICGHLPKIAVKRRKVCRKVP
jgi:hypothetical protein